MAKEDGIPAGTADPVSTLIVQGALKPAGGDAPKEELRKSRLLSRAAQAALQGAVGAYNCLPVFAGVAGSRLLSFSEQRAVWPA